MALSSTRRQRIIEFSTPKVADLVVVELKDASKNLSSAGSADDSSYGTPHPDTSKFPDFKLALIKNADDQQGQFQLWYYIKDRAEQDRYNWEFQAAGVGSSRYDSVVRTYVIPRYGSGTDGALGGGQVAGTDVFDESLPAIASTMPSTIHDPFGSGLGNATTPDTNYVLFEKKQVRSGDETLDSLYVVEQRVYVKKVPTKLCQRQLPLVLRIQHLLWASQPPLYLNGTKSLKIFLVRISTRMILIVKLELIAGR